MVELVRQNLKINKARFSKIRKKILDSIDANIIVEHVGSTAIPKMYGKNILDVLVGVNNSYDFETAIKGLENIGFVGSEKSRSDEYMFFAYIMVAVISCLFPPAGLLALYIVDKFDH